MTPGGIQNNNLGWGNILETHSVIGGGNQGSGYSNDFSGTKGGQHHYTNPGYGYS